jgi:Pin2-interacting protein X1
LFIYLFIYLFVYLGVGCSKNYADNWIAHQDDFNAILSSLNESVGESTAAKEESSVTEKEKLRASLEAKSKSSRTRVQ